MPNVQGSIIRFMREDGPVGHLCLFAGAIYLSWVQAAGFVLSSSLRIDSKIFHLMLIFAMSGFLYAFPAHFRLLIRLLLRIIGLDFGLFGSSAVLAGLLFCLSLPSSLLFAGRLLLSHQLLLIDVHDLSYHHYHCAGRRHCCCHAFPSWLVRLF